MTRVLISNAEFRDWLACAEPGDWLEYHRGFLVWDRMAEPDLSEQDRSALVAIADATLEAAAAGKVHLVQRRKGPFTFAYFAIKAGTERQSGNVTYRPPRTASMPNNFQRHTHGMPATSVRHRRCGDGAPILLVRRTTVCGF